MSLFSCQCYQLDVSRIRITHFRIVLYSFRLVKMVNRPLIVSLGLLFVVLSCFNFYGEHSFGPTYAPHLFESHFLSSLSISLSLNRSRRKQSRLHVARRRRLHLQSNQGARYESSELALLTAHFAVFHSLVVSSQLLPSHAKQILHGQVHSHQLHGARRHLRLPRRKPE